MGEVIPLRDLRTRAGCTQVDVASSLGISQSQISSWESGVARVSDQHIPGLARLFGCTVENVEAAAADARAQWRATRDLRLATELRRRRETAHMTRQDLADACGISASAVVLWEEGAVHPGRERLVALGATLAVSPRVLLAEAGYDRQEVADALRPDEYDRTATADLLRRARRTAGFSQQQVGRATGMSQNSVSAIETSVYLPDRATLEVLRELYGLDVEEVDRAYRRARIQTGQVPAVTVSWPVDPSTLAPPRWFRQLRAHLGLTRSELASRLDVESAVIAEIERGGATGLPTAFRAPTALQVLASLAELPSTDLLIGFEPDRAAPVAHLLDLVGRDLVAACDTIGQLLTVIHLRGVSWTRIGQIAGTSRQSPIYWAEATVIPQLPRARALVGLFDGEVTVEDLEQLWRRTKHPPSV